MSALRVVSLSVVLLATAALGEEALDGGLSQPADSVAASQDAGTKVDSVALLELGANEGGKAQAQPVAALLASKLAAAKDLKVITQQDIATMIGVERQKQLLATTCSEDSACLTELSGALGARYVVSGRLDRFGTRYTLTASVFDSARATALAHPLAEAKSEDALPDAVDEVAKALLGALGRAPVETASVGPKPEAASETGPDVGLRAGNNFINGLSSLSPAGDLVLGYRFDPAWVGFLQVGFAYARSTQDVTGSVSILPTVLGARHLYRTDTSFQPYWGVGLGMQLAIGQFGPFQDVGGVLPSVIGLVGFHWFFTRTVAVGLEGSTNLAQTVLGLSGRTSDVGAGLNLKPSLSVTFRP